MTATRDLIARLEPVEGLTLTPDADLARLSTFRIGGRADLQVDVHHETALAALLEQVAAAGVPFQLLGLGSNVLLPDAGLRGVVARLGGDFRSVIIEGTTVTAGAAVTLARLAKDTAAGGLSGLEPLSGFPSTVGGAVFMNAGCYGTEIKDLLVTARLASPSGRLRSIGAADLGAGYRSTVLQETGEMVLMATFALVAEAPERCLERIEELNRRRWESLPAGNPSVGSIFRNPPGDHAGRLIDRCGLKGRRRGGAQISPKHGNVIVNRGGALAAEVLALMAEARLEVDRRFGVVLEPEVVLAGGLRRDWELLVSAPQPGGSDSA